MDSALAKELKDAGFHFEWPPDEFNTGDTFFPALEELIEACDKDFDCLRLGGVTQVLEWQSWAFDHVWRQPHYTTGSTPTEAVARLWLALNKPVVQ